MSGPFRAPDPDQLAERLRLESAARREAEARAEQALRELESARTAARSARLTRSDFLVNMSHELRTPLNVVIGLTEVLLRSDLTDVQREHLRTVMDSGESLLAVVNDVLDYSKLEAGRLELERVEFDIHDAIGDALAPLAVRTRGKDVELVCLISPALPARLVGDPARLGQVIGNLVANAIEFTEHGEIIVRVDPEISDGTLLLHVSVRDTGVGFEPEDLDRISEVFAPVDAPDSQRRHGGNGLGLALSRRLVEQMGGNLRVERAPGGGSTFHFAAKLELASPAPEERGEESFPLEGTRVLIVDDNLTQRTVLEAVTAAAGMRPMLAASAAEGFERLEQALKSGDPVRLLLADVQMPETDGLDLAQRVRRDSRFYDVEIIFLAPAGTDHDRERCEALRGARLVKPVKQPELLRQITRTLGLGREPAAAPRAAAGQDAPPALRMVLDDGHEVYLRDDGREVYVAQQKILLVEDSVANQRVALAILREQRHDVTVAQNGREALELLAQQEFDLVLMDVEMPEMDGLRVASVIRHEETSTGRRLPIIAMTAHALEGDRERCLAAGMDDYISKPVHREDVFEAITRAIGFSERNTTPGATNPFAAMLEQGLVDWAGPLGQVDGDRDALREVVEAYIEEIQETLEKLPGDIASGDVEEVHRRAHTLKSAMRTFGVVQAYQLADELEKATATEVPADAAERLERVRESVEPVLPELTRFLETGEIPR